MIRRKRKSTKPIPPPGESKPFNRVSTGLIIAVISTVILGGIPFGLGKYIEFHSPGPFDSGAFVYSAQHLLQGAKLGVDELSSARPGTLLANIIGVRLFGYNDTGPKIVQMALQLSALTFMFYTLRKVFGSASAVVGTTIAAIYLSAPLIAKFGNVKEQFMIPFMIAAACCFLLYGVSQKRCWLIASGFFAVQPYYFKPTGLSIVIALVLYLTLGNVFCRKWKTLILEFGLFLSGYIIGLLVPGSLFLWQDAPAAMLNTLPIVLLEAGFILGLIVAGVIAVIVFIKKSDLLKKLRQVSKWIWISALCLIIIAFIFAIYMIKKEPGSDKSDIISYVRDIPFIRIPRQMVGAQLSNLLTSTGLRGGYVSNSWKTADLSALSFRIFRYYMALSVPILLAIGSIITAACVWMPKLFKKILPTDIQSKYVWTLALWWVLDMTFVWGSPRSYEQYYLPLCASGAMLSGFIVWKWGEKLLVSVNKIPWLALGAVAAITLGYLTVPIFIGQRYSPDTGSDYVKNPHYGQRQRGFVPALRELPSRKKGAWVAAGDYIRTHSSEDDTIYVWGWYPGIYVQAQRLAPVPNAFEGDMHVKLPQRLKSEINYLVKKMKERPPKFIVDSRKQHFPNDRPPLELWPIVPQNMFGNERPRFLNNRPQEIAAFDAALTKYLETEIEPDEAKRYEAMKPFRNFVMTYYKPIIREEFGPHRLYEWIDTQP